LKKTKLITSMILIYQLLKPFLLMKVISHIFLLRIINSKRNKGNTKLTTDLRLIYLSQELLISL
jgi:hypothetical protein